MSIYRKANGIFYYDFRVGGHRYHGSTHETQKGRALQYESLMRTDAIQGRMPPSMRKTPKLAEYAKYFLEEMGAQTKAGHLADNTLKSYVYGVELWKETRLWNERIDRIDRDGVAKEVFPSPSVGNAAIRTLRRMLHLAEESNLIRRTPKLKLYPDIKRTTIIDPWLEDLMLESAKEPLRTVIIVALDSFMRPEEIVEMRWENIFWDRRVVFVSEGKTINARRNAPLTSRMIEVLKARKLQQKVLSPWVFPSTGTATGQRSKSGHYWSTSLGKMWGAMKKKVIEKAKVVNPGWEWPSDLVLYSCRHTGITGFAQVAGDNPWMIARAAGHSDLATTQRYVHLNTNTADVMNKVVEMKLGKKQA